MAPSIRTASLQFLHQPLAEHGFSTGFSDFCAQQCWTSLHDVLQQPIEQLIHYPGFYETCYHELVAFFRQREMLYLLTYYAKN